MLIAAPVAKLKPHWSHHPKPLRLRPEQLNSPALASLPLMSALSRVVVDLYVMRAVEISKVVLLLSGITSTGRNVKNSGENDRDGESTFEQRIRIQDPGEIIGRRH